MKSIELSKRGNGRFVAFMDDNVWCYSPLIKVKRADESACLDET